MSYHAVAPGVDLSTHARSLARARDAAMSGSATSAEPRPLVSRSWRRTLGHGLDPDKMNPRRGFDSLGCEARRDSSPLAAVIDQFRQVTETYADASRCILVVTDADGIILWRYGDARVLSRADGLGFVDGALWTEQAVGTNAIGTAIVEASPVQLFAAEHFEDRQVPWYCTAAPIHDPRTGALLGIVDISGPALALHPVVAALVDSMVRLAEQTLRVRHLERLETLRSRAGMRWNLVSGPALLVDKDGWVAESCGLPSPGRVSVPQGGRALTVPGIGPCHPEEIGDGWILRSQKATDAVRVEFDVTDKPVLTVPDASPPLRCPLTVRQAEILLVLHLAGSRGLSQLELSRALYGDADHAVTVRAEISRLRRTVGEFLATRPYRIAPDVELVVRPPSRRELRHTDLVATSTAPGLREVR